MSALYSVVETICCGLNKLPGGGIKKIMDKVLTTSTGKEKLPVWVKKTGVTVYMPWDIRLLFTGQECAFTAHSVRA